ncbi:MAG: hypothetical protein HQK58_15150 [Deltaproteobacteria bacterium]|nr:hypothetical protein [Deltaproteobacteria bacterium]
MASLEEKQSTRPKDIKAPEHAGRYAQVNLPPTEQLLVEGGDARIALDPDRALNMYGCQPFPDPDLGAFGSSTASVISHAGFAAADRLRRRLLAVGAEPQAITYARELNRIRRELTHLCGVSDIPGLEVVLAASGTDIHLIAAQLAGGTASRPTVAVTVEADETGSGVPLALAGRHFSTRATSGYPVIKNTALAYSGIIETATVPIRLVDGTPRQAAAIDAEFKSLVTGAVSMGRRVLLVSVDLTKTGCLAPSLACILEMQRGLPDTVDVLVDACQFRLAPSTLRAYLEHDLMVAITGSKFITGPSFAGALLIPSSMAGKLRARPFPRALRGYSTRADWPQTWAVDGILDNMANFGLLLRWEAALEDLRTFRSVPEPEVTNFLQAFADAIQHRLKNDPIFAPLPAPQIDRRPLIEAASWDHVPTIFPFLLYHPGPSTGQTPLNREETNHVYRLLPADLSNHHGLANTRLNSNLAKFRGQLGQPVVCGNRNGVPVSALRLCSSARLVIKASLHKGREAAKVIENALTALDKTAALVKTGWFQADLPKPGIGQK